MASGTFQVGANNDDCYRRWNGSTWVWTNGTDYYSVGWYGNTYQMNGVGLRFPNVTIPQGSTITTAYIICTAEQNRSATTCNARFHGEDVDDPSGFNSQADFENRRTNNLTTASVDWDNIGAWVTDSTYNSPSLVSIIQEIVNRSGFSSGNAIVLFFDDFDDRSSHVAACSRVFYEYNQSSSDAVQLYVEWTPPAPTGVGMGAFNPSFIMGLLLGIMEEEKVKKKRKVTAIEKAISRKALKVYVKWQKKLQRALKKRKRRRRT